VLDGTDVVGLDARLREVRGTKAAMIFQEPSTALNPVFTVGGSSPRACARTGVLEEEAKAKAIEMLGRVGIPDPERRVDDYPHQFSGGQKQRIVIAMALALDPP
jgi:peptide/nickel transport system ATP-binding protein